MFDMMKNERNRSVVCAAYARVRAGGRRSAPNVVGRDLGAPTVGPSHGTAAFRGAVAATDPTKYAEAKAALLALLRAGTNLVLTCSSGCKRAVSNTGEGCHCLTVAAELRNELNPAAAEEPQPDQPHQPRSSRRSTAGAGPSRLGSGDSWGQGADSRFASRPYRHAEHVASLNEADAPGPHHAILLPHQLPALQAAMTSHPMLATADVHAHDGIWYYGHPSLNRTLDAAQYGLPRPQPLAVGPLAAFLPRRPAALASFAERLAAASPHLPSTDVWVSAGKLVAPGPHGSPVQLANIAAPNASEIDGYEGPLFPSTDTSTTDTAAAQETTSFDPDPNDLDAAAAAAAGDGVAAAAAARAAADAERAEPPSPNPPVPPPVAETQPRLPPATCRPRPASGCVGDNQFPCRLWPCPDAANASSFFWCNKPGQMADHLRRKHLGARAAHGPDLPRDALPVMIKQCPDCFSIFCGEARLATHVRTRAGCLPSLTAKKAADDAAAAATATAAAAAASANPATSTDAEDPSELDPTAPSPRHAAAALTDPVAANTAFLNTIPPDSPSLHEVQSAALPSIPGAAVVAWNGLCLETIRHGCKWPNSNHAFSLFLAAPRLLLAPPPRQGRRLDLPALLKTRILRLRAGEATQLWSLHPWCSTAKVPDQIQTIKPENLAAAVNADLKHRTVVSAFRRPKQIPFAPPLLRLAPLFTSKVVTAPNPDLAVLAEQANTILPNGPYASIGFADSTDHAACTSRWSRLLSSAADTAPDGTGMRTRYYTLSTDLFSVLGLWLRALTSRHQTTQQMRTFLQSKALSCQIKPRKANKQWPTTVEQIDNTRPLSRHNNIFRRAPAGHLARRCTRAVCGLLLALGQYGLATAGTDALAHAAQHNYDIHRESLAALDNENAYGTLARTAMLNILLALAAAYGPGSAAEDLLLHVLALYSAPGPTHLFLSDGDCTSAVLTVYQTDGIDQGENNGNLVYNLVYTLIVVPLHRRFYPAPTFGAMLLHDDTSLSGPASPVDCDAAAVASRADHLLAIATAADAEAAAATARGDASAAADATTRAADARARTCRGTHATITAAAAAAAAATGAASAHDATAHDADAAAAARAALAALTGKPAPAVAELIRRLGGLPAPAQTLPPKNGKLAPARPLSTLRAAHAAATHLSRSLIDMFDPKPLPATATPADTAQPQLFPGDDDPSRPFPYPSLPAAIDVWAYLTQQLLRTRVAKGRSVALTHPDAEHATPFPPWPEGTELPSHGATTLAGCAIGAPAGRDALLAKANAKYAEQLSAILELEGVPCHGRFLAAVHGTQPSLAFNHHFRGSPASSTIALARSSKIHTARAVAKLFGIDPAHLDCDATALTYLIFLRHGDGGLGLADPTNTYPVQLAATIDTSPAIAAHPALAAAFAAAADWPHSRSTLFRDAHRAAAVVAGLLALHHAATAAHASAAERHEHAAFFARVLTTDRTSFNVAAFPAAHGRHAQRSITRVVAAHSRDHALGPESPLSTVARVALRAAARPHAAAPLDVLTLSPANSLSDSEIIYYIHTRLGLAPPHLPADATCHPSCMVAGPGAAIGDGLREELRMGWHQFACRVGGHRIRKHNQTCAVACEYARADGDYAYDLCNYLHSSVTSGAMIDAVLRNWRRSPRPYAIDLTISCPFLKTYRAAAARDASYVIQLRNKEKEDHHAAGCKALSRDFGAWVYTAVGDSGPDAFHLFFSNIYRLMAQLDAANHLPAWRAARRQAGAHAAILATLFRASAHSLIALSVNPANATGRLNKKRHNDPTADAFRPRPRPQ